MPRMPLPKRNTQRDSCKGKRFVFQVCQNQVLRIRFLPGGKTMKALLVATVLTMILAATVTLLTIRPHEVTSECTAAEC